MNFALKNIKSGSLSLLGIASRRWVFSGPRLAALIISRDCNSRCIMCWYHSGLIHKSEEDKKPSEIVKFMDYELAERIVLDLHRMGTYKIILGGHGEPTLHPQFDRLLDLLIKHRMLPYVISNGLTLDEPRATSWARKHAVFRFSIHAGDVETWLKIHPECSASQFEELSRSLKNMAASSSAKVATMHAIQRSNYRTIRNMIEHARELGIKNVEFFPIRTDCCLPQLTLGPTEEQELIEELRWCLRYAEKNGISTNIGEYLATNRFIYGGQLRTQQLYEKLPCYIGWTYTEFDIDGLIRPCENSQRIMGYAGKESIRDIWNSADYRTFRQEAFMMPKRGTFVQGCVCRSCPMSKFNINIHNLLRLKSFNFGEA